MQARVDDDEDENEDEAQDDKEEASQKNGPVTVRPNPEAL